jgi:hypothetical protein
MKTPFTIVLLATIAAVARGAPEFWERRGAIVAEVEDAALHAAAIVDREGASGGV